MALDRFVNSLETMLEEARASLQSVESADALEQLRVKFVGAKNGALKSVQKMLAEVAPEDRPAAGKRFNEVREALQAALDGAAERFSSGGLRNLHSSRSIRHCLGFVL